MPSSTSFIFPDEADNDSAKSMALAMSELPNHIAAILKGMNEKNFKKYVSVDWDNFKIDGKLTPKLNLLIHDAETGEVVPTFLQGPYKLAPSFGRLTGNAEPSITTDEQATILDKKKAEDRSKYVAPNIGDAKNKLTMRSFFDHENNEVDPSIEALERLEKIAHIIIAEKCQEQLDGKSKTKRINELDAKNCASQPENIPLLGKKFHQLVHKWVWENHGYSQLRMDRNATKKGKPDEVVGLTPKLYSKMFNPEPTKDNPNPQKRIPFPFAFKVLCQEVPDNSDDEDEDPKLRAKKEIISIPDPSRSGASTKAEVIRYGTRSLVNYKSKKGSAQDLALITKNDTLRGEICTGKYGVPIAMMECTQSRKYGGYFALKMSDLSWGLRSENAFGVTVKIEGFIKPEREEEENPETVSLALQFTRKMSKPAPMETIDEDVFAEENEEPPKRKRSLDSIDEEPELERSKKHAKKKAGALSSEEVGSSEDNDSESD